MDAAPSTSTVCVLARTPDDRRFVCVVVDGDGVTECTAGGTSRTSRHHYDMPLAHFDKLIDVLATSSFYRRRLIARSPNGALLVVHVRAIRPCDAVLDVRFGQMIKTTLNAHINTHEQLWWLSTLGGAYSSMGDYETKYALTAGNLSRIQHAIATHLEDPVLQARCRLYLALAFSQCGRLREAKQIVRWQHELAVSLRSDLLRNCCLGVWSRLQAVHRRQRTRGCT